jgi:hypothetical protein
LFVVGQRVAGEGEVRWMAHETQRTLHAIQGGAHLTAEV